MGLEKARVLPTISNEYQQSRSTRPPPTEKLGFFIAILGYSPHLAPFSRTGFPACSTKSGFSCEAGKPVHKKLIEKGATSQLQPT